MAGVTCEAPLPVREAKNGDPGAWDQLFKRYQLPLYVYVCELVRDEATSLDIVQETFINALRHIERLREEEKFGSWLFSIAHQKCLQLWRKSKPMAPFEKDQIDNFAANDLDPAECLVRKEQEEEFLASLGQLPWPQRSVLVLHFLEDFSLEEIAEICGLALGTVKSRLFYAKKALRKLIADRS